MVEPINIGPVGVPKPAEPTQPKTDQTESAKSFKDMLFDSINKVNELQSQADDAINKLITGQTDNMTEVFSAVEKADLAFKTLMQIRNKIVDAYGEIRQMRI